MPWIRTRPHINPDDVTIEMRKRSWWNPFSWFFPSAVEVSTAWSRVNKLDWEIIDLIEKLEKKLAARGALVDAALDERQALKRELDDWGKSDWFFVSDDEFKEKIVPLTASPEPTRITGFLNPGVINKYQLNRKIKKDSRDTQQSRRAGGPSLGQFDGRPHIPGQQGQVTAYTLPELADKSLHIAEDTGAGQVVAYKEPQERKGSNLTPEQRNAINKLKGEYRKRDGETKEEWERRLMEML